MYPHKPCIPIIIVLLLHPLFCITRQACDCLWVRLWRCSMARQTLFPSPLPAYSTGFLQLARKEKKRRSRACCWLKSHRASWRPGLGDHQASFRGWKDWFFFQAESEGAGSSVDAATRCVLKLKPPYLIETFRLSNDLLWMTSSFHSFHTAVWLSPDHALAWVQPKSQWAWGG